MKRYRTFGPSLKTLSPHKIFEGITKDIPRTLALIVSFIAMCGGVTFISNYHHPWMMKYVLIVFPVLMALSVIFFKPPYRWIAFAIFLFLYSQMHDEGLPGATLVPNIAYHQPETAPGDAEFNKAVKYYNGDIGGKRDYAEAYFWFSIAAERQGPLIASLTKKDADAAARQISSEQKDAVEKRVAQWLKDHPASPPSAASKTCSIAADCRNFCKGTGGDCSPDGTPMCANHQCVCVIKCL